MRQNLLQGGGKERPNIFFRINMNLRIVRRLAPPHCTDADTVIHNDCCHVQNDAMLDTVSKDDIDNPKKVESHFNSGRKYQASLSFM
nr:hypothetical protein [Tanacetum cinerariifolium]